MTDLSLDAVLAAAAAFAILVAGIMAWIVILENNDD
jgi:hypothetical protein